MTSLLEGFVHLHVPPSLADCCCCCKAYLFLCVDTPISYRQCFHPTAQNIQYTSYIYNEHYTTDTPNFIIISRILIIVAYAMHSMHCHCSHGHCILTLVAMNLWSFWKIGDAVWIQCHTSWSLHLMSQFWKCRQFLKWRTCPNLGNDDPVMLVVELFQVLPKIKLRFFWCC